MPVLFFVLLMHKAGLTLLQNSSPAADDVGRIQTSDVFRHGGSQFAPEMFRDEDTLNSRLQTGGKTYKVNR